MRATIILLCAYCFIPGAVAQDLLQSYYGQSAGDFFGYSVGNAGDTNNDGYPDQIIGAPSDNAHDGSAWLYSGKTGTLLRTFVPSGTASQFGWDVDGAGDTNLDGFADVVIGAVDHQSSGQHRGRIYVFSGKDGSLRFTVDGAANGDSLGISVTGAGDVNHDGRADVAAGSYVGGHGGGYAQLISGVDGSVLRTYYGAASDSFGVEIDDALDVNLDGYHDLIVGATQSLGYATVLSGKDGVELRRFTGPKAGINFGYAVAGIGDRDCDHYDDVAVSAYADNRYGYGRGSVWVYSGRTGALLRFLIGAAPADFFGRDISGVGDLNADGRADLLVGSDRTTEGDPGVVQGICLAHSAFFSVRGVAADDELGEGLSAAGDVNLDGFADFIAGSRLNDVAGIDAGSAYVYGGNDMFLSLNRTQAHPGTQVIATHRELLEGLPVTLAIVAINGSQTFIPLASGKFAADWGWVKPFVAGGGVGTTLTLQSFMQALGKKVDSNKVVLTIN